jgi:ankyrin repeat protein
MSEQFSEDEFEDETKVSFVKSFCDLYHILYMSPYEDDLKTEDAFQRRIQFMNNMTDSMKKLVIDTISNGGDINEADECGATALLTVFCDYIYISEKMDNIHFENACSLMKFLVENGANINAKPYGGITVLMDACHRLYPDNNKAIRLLFELKADPNVQDGDGCTALHWASKYIDNKEIINLLIDMGVDTNIKNKKGKDFIYEMKPELLEDLYRDSIQKIKKIQSVKTCINEGYKAQDAIIISYLNHSSETDEEKPATNK